MSFVKKYLAISSSVYLLNAEDNLGLPLYYVVEVTNPKFEMFKLAMTKPAFKPSDYGKVLLSGYGESPSEAQMAKLREDYKKQP